MVCFLFLYELKIQKSLPKNLFFPSFRPKLGLGIDEKKEQGFLCTKFCRVWTFFRSKVLGKKTNVKSL